MLALLSLSLSLAGTRLVAAVPLNTAIPFSPGFDFVSVASLAESLPSHSWEFGTAAEALLELYNPELSVFGPHPFPIPKVKSSSEVQALTYAASKIVIGTGANGLSDGDGAVGDPASLGVSAVMLGEIDGNETVANAAQEEVDYITTQAPRFWNGAISHRAEYAELWADFVYMAPPFLAYHAAVHNNITLLQETVTQLGLYRQILQSNSSSSSPSHGAWEHIIGPVNLDTGLWSTGNAWAAAGMTRVLATVLKAPVANAPKQLLWRVRAEKEITDWIKEILDAAIHSPLDNGLLRNYLNDTTGDGHGFGEISGSALLASVAYRMAVLQPLHFGIVSPYVKFAEGIRKTLGMGHVEGDGRVVPAVNPLGWGDTTPFLDGSPEGQNFVVLMYAAWRDCVRAGVCLLVG